MCLNLRRSKIRNTSFTLVCASFFSNAAFAEEKTFAITLPALTLGREGVLRVEYNFFNRESIALDWTQWVGSEGQKEELTRSQIRNSQGASLLTKGRELGLMFAQYSDSLHMSGFNYAMGLGYRAEDIDWTKQKTPTEERYFAKARGPTMRARAGYRFVGKDIGFLIGTFVGAKYFLSQITEISSDQHTRRAFGAHDKTYLEQTLAKSFQIGLEIGWAF